MIVKGSDLMLFTKLDDSMKSIAYATSHTLDIQGDEQETSSKDSGKWKDSQITKFGWTATSENLCSGVGVNDAFGILFTKMISREPIDVHMTVAEDANNDAGAPETGWTPTAGMGLKGKARVKGISLNAPDGQNATMTVSLTGIGKISLDGNTGD